MKRAGFCVIFALLLSGAVASGMTQEQRQQYLEKFNQIMPPVASFTAWQQRTQALPPDFDTLPKINSLPDPLKFLDGRPVNAQNWGARRDEVRQLFEKYMIGSLPPRPTIGKAEVQSDTPATGYHTLVTRLQYGPDGKGELLVTMVIPQGDGPFPVLIGSMGSNALLRRGYIACTYSGSVDQLTNQAELYPNFDFASMGQRAWLAHLVVDYLVTLPQVDKARIAITGYSRDGKMAAIAAALDDRIAAVVAGSTGVGGVLPWRVAGERGYGESIESTTRSYAIWFAPQLRFFAGREDRLPVDGNLLVSLIAPRSCLILYGLNDEVSNSWGNEQSYYSALKAYKLLGVPERVSILRLPGFHGANDLQASLDWLDIQFGRSHRTWHNDFLFPWDYDQWLANSRESTDLAKFPAHTANDLLASVNSKADWEAKVPEIRKSVQWMLGDEPPMMPPGARGAFGRGLRGRGARGATTGASIGATTEPTTAPAFGRGGFGRGARGPATGPNPAQLGPDVVAWVIQRGGSFGWLEPEKSQTTSRSLMFGDGVRGDLYYPANTPAGAKLPTVIWLHGYSYPLGYMWVYHTDLHPILALVKAGYAVLAFDQTGHGSRMNEFGAFYDRYPHWSRLGRMVEDTRAGIDALQRDSLVDPQRIYLFGHSMGGMVALHTAALDSRVKGVVSISGFTPMRTDTADKGTGGLARFSQDLNLAPRLGFFIGQEAKLPYDYNELIASIAPRPVYVMQPQLDRDATPGEVHAAIDQAKKIYSLYDAPDKLMLDEPWDYNRLTGPEQERIIQWMGQNMSGMAVAQDKAPAVAPTAAAAVTADGLQRPIP